MTAKIFERMGFNAELIPAAQSTAGKRQRTILLQGHVRLTAGSDAWEGRRVITSRSRRNGTP